MANNVWLVVSNSVIFEEVLLKVSDLYYYCRCISESKILDPCIVLLKLTVIFHLKNSKIERLMFKNFLPFDFILTVFFNVLYRVSNCLYPYIFHAGLEPNKAAV